MWLFLYFWATLIFTSPSARWPSGYVLKAADQGKTFRGGRFSHFGYSLSDHGAVA